MPPLLVQLGIMLGSLVIVLLIGLAVVIVGALFCFSTVVLARSGNAGQEVAPVLAFLLGIVIPFGLYWILFARSLSNVNQQNRGHPLGESSEREAE